jgi:hypothetical protein
LIDCCVYLVRTEPNHSSLFIDYVDYPLTEERRLECFSPLNELFKRYDFRKYDHDEHAEQCLSEKDERQLRKLRFVAIIRQLCLNADDNDQTKKSFGFLVTYVKDDLVYFESSVINHDQRLSMSNYGVPGDRRTNRTNDEARSQTKTSRGTRNVALRQFLEPIQQSTSNNRMF